MELGDHLRPQVEVPQRLVVRARVLVDDADAQVGGVAVGIPEPRDVEPGVQGRQDDEEQRHQPRRGDFRHALDIAREHAQDVAHSSVASLRRSTRSANAFRQ